MIPREYGGNEMLSIVTSALKQEQISRGELQPLRQWLRTRIHCVGKTRSADELVREITGAPLRGEYFLNYLETKFAEIYEL